MVEGQLQRVLQQGLQHAVRRRREGRVHRERSGHFLHDVSTRKSAVGENGELISSANVEGNKTGRKTKTKTPAIPSLSWGSRPPPPQPPPTREVLADGGEENERREARAGGDGGLSRRQDGERLAACRPSWLANSCEGGRRVGAGGGGRGRGRLSSHVRRLAR